jgi:hypothetical protein
MTPFLFKNGARQYYELAEAEWDRGKPGPDGRANVPITGALLGYLSYQIDAAMRVFQDSLYEAYGIVEITRCRAMFATQPASPEPTPVRGKHLDAGDKVIVGLWYFAHPGDRAGGHLKLGLNTVIPYQPNSMVIFPNLPSAWHEVTPRGPSIYDRRFINFVAETDVRLHDYCRDPLGRDRLVEVKARPDRSK